MHIYYQLKPKNEIEQKMFDVLSEKLPEFVEIISNEKERSKKWSQEWSGTITILNRQTGKYYAFDYMGNDDDGVTDFLDTNFRKVTPIKKEIITYV
jgi:uncharacterized protein YifE (UPF0438 family)